LSITDNGEQNYLLARAMRNYLKWDAKSIVGRETWLGYRTDWTTTNNLEEMNEFAEDCDLFIFQDMLISPTDETGEPSTKIQKLANKNNTIISGSGTLMRNNLQALQEMLMEGWHIIPPMSDPTIALYMGAAPFEHWMIPTAEILDLTKDIKRKDPGDEITLVHAATKTKRKGTKLWRKAVDEVKKTVQNIVYEEITRTPWKEAIRKKATGHVLLNSLGDESYGLSCLESLLLGQIVISNITEWDYLLHPDLPMVTTNKREQGEVIQEVIKYIRERAPAGKSFDEEDNANWVIEHFSEREVVQRWKKYIRWMGEEGE
jgi:molybdopterin synthase catalytic subunit